MMNTDQSGNVTKTGNGALSDSAFGAAQKLAGHVGVAAANVAGATKTAGKQVGLVASQEITKLKADLDDLIIRLPSLSEVDLNAAKDRLLEKIAIAQDAASQAASDARAKVSDGVEAAGGMVRERPFQSVAVAAGMGILVGMLISRNR